MKITEETPDKIIIEYEYVRGSYDGIIGLLLVVIGIFLIIYINFGGFFFVLLGILLFLAKENTTILDKNSQKVIIIENSSERKEIPFSELGDILIEEFDLGSFHGPYCPNTWDVRLITNDNYYNTSFPKIEKIIGEIYSIFSGIYKKPDFFLCRFHDKQKSILFAERVSKITGKEVVCKF